MGKSFFSLILVVILALIAGLALLHPGLPPTHDGEYHVVRFYLFNEAIHDGNLYPRWAGHLNNNFGVPLFNFVYPLPNYMATIFHLFGISFINSFKWEMLLATIAGGIFFYLWSKEFWGRWGGIVSSAFYIFSPYHLVDIYIRGSVGEVWALAFFPGFLWCVTRFIKYKKITSFLWSSIFLSLIIFSHNILALMFFPFAISYILYLIIESENKRYLILNTFYIILTGLGLSAIFWLPAIYETKYVTGLQIFDIFAHFPDLYQLLIPTWGSGFSGAGLQNELSYQIGAANLFVVFLTLIAIILQVRRKNNNFFYTLFFMIWFGLIFFLMLPASLPVWQTIPFMNYFQFPWRLLSVEILFTSFLAGNIPSILSNNKIRILFSIFLVFLTFILGIGYTRPAYYLYRNDNYYTTRSNFIDGTNSPGNVFNTIFLKTIPNKEKQRMVILRDKGEIILTKEKSNMYSFKINVLTKSEVLANVAYYPGWEVYVNNVRKEIKPTYNGRFTFSLPAGDNKVNVIFGDNFIRKFSVFISFISLVYILVLFMGRRFVTINR